MSLEEKVGTYVLLNATVQKILYPRGRVTIQGGEFAVLSVSFSTIKGEVAPELIESTHGMETVVVCGMSASISSDDIRKTNYKILAKLNVNKKAKSKKFEISYEIETMNRFVTLESDEDKRQFLCTFFSPNVVCSLYSVYDDPFELLRTHNVNALCKIKGIKTARAIALINKYEETIDLAEAFIKLAPLGLSATMVNKLTRQYRSADTAYEKVITNPYILMTDISGIGWKKADEIASRLGITGSHPRRIAAFIYFLLDKRADEENDTWVNLSDLVQEVAKELGQIDENTLRECLVEGIQNNLLYYEERSNRIGLQKYRTIEEKIVQNLARLLGVKPAPLHGLEQAIYYDECINEYEYSDDQKTAMKMIDENSVCLITGFGGTGKSTLLSPIAHCVANQNLRLAQTCLSGKAASNLNKITGIQGQTIHKLLGYTPESGFSFGSFHQLKMDVVILDELSMVSEEIFLQLLEAMPTGSRLVMLGDNGQLESIGAGCLIRDFVNSKTLPSFNLQKIFRQAAKSGIILDSIHVYNQEQLIPPDFSGSVTHGELNDMTIISRQTPAETADTAIDLFAKMLGAGISVEDIAVICAKKTVGDTSCRAINERIQAKLRDINSSEFVSGFYQDNQICYQIKYYVGDRVLITKNCYKVPVDMEGGKDTSIFNGNIGTVTKVDTRHGLLYVKIDDEVVILDKSKIENLQLGYAITNHKAQGSTIPYVIALCDNSAYMLLSKEFLYTQISRAKKRCFLVGSPMAIRRATQTSGNKKYKTWLSELLLEEFFKNPLDTEEKK